MAKRPDLKDVDIFRSGQRGGLHEAARSEEQEASLCRAVQTEPAPGDRGTAPTYTNINPAPTQDPHHEGQHHTNPTGMDDRNKP